MHSFGCEIRENLSVQIRIPDIESDSLIIIVVSGQYQEEKNFLDI